MDVCTTKLIKQFGTTSSDDLSKIQYADLFNNHKKFGIDPKRSGEFWDMTCGIIEKDEYKEKMDSEEEDISDFTPFGHSISEVIDKVTIPVVAHFKFAFDLNSEQREDPFLYDEDFMAYLVHIIQFSIINKVEITQSLSELITTVEESKVWTVGETSYCQIRLVFPYCQVNTEYQRTDFRNHLIKELKNSDIIDEFKVYPLTVDWNTIMLPIGNSFPIYRGKYLRADAPMELSSIYHIITSENLETETYTKHPLGPGVFNPSSHQYIHTGIITGDFLKKEVDFRYWLPMFLSIHFWAGECKPKIMETPKVVMETLDTKDKDSISSNDPKIMIHYLLPLLSDARFTLQPFWEDVMQIIYNIFSGGEKGLMLAIKYSSRIESVGRDKATCISHYSSLTPNHLTIKTIGWYARDDNIKGYQNWHSKWLQSCMYEALSCIHDDVADMVYKLFWLDHFWAGKNRWYMYNNNRLVEQDDATDLKRVIKSDMVSVYKKLRGSVNTKSLESGQQEVKKAEATIKAITNLIAKLGNQTFKSQLIKAAKQQFEVKNFDKFKDSDPNKLSMTNCVIVCCGDHAYPVKGKMEDFITKSTFTPYRSDLSWSHPLVLRLMDWLMKIFNDRDLLHFFLKDTASMLYGMNAEKRLRAWCGDGDNSKTMLAKAFQQWLGMYCIDFPTTFLTAKKQGGGPSPELAQAGGTHLGFVPETEDDEKIREGTAKRVTGGDRVYARFLNDNGGSMAMTAKVIMMCNKIPEFTSNSKALRNRFVYIPFLGTWSIDAPSDPKEQVRTRTYPMDPYFDMQIPELSQALGWVAVQYYNLYKTEGLETPKIVKEYTERHWRENDPILLFIQDRITYSYLDKDKKERDMNKSVSASQIHVVYKQWFSSNYTGNPVPSVTQLKHDLLQHLGPQGSGRKWYGLQVNKPSQPMATLGDPTGYGGGDGAPSFDQMKNVAHGFGKGNAPPSDTGIPSLQRAANLPYYQ